MPNFGLMISDYIEDNEETDSELKSQKFGFVNGFDFLAKNREKQADK